MVIRLFARLCLLVSLIGGLAACQNKEADVPGEVSPALSLFAPPMIPSELVEVSEVYYGYLREDTSTEDDNGDPYPPNQALIERGNSLSLLSYDPAMPVEADPESSDQNPMTVLNANTGIALSLDTEMGTSIEPEYSVISNGDTILLVDLNRGTVTGLAHFFNRVCEILPSESAVIEGDPGDDQHYTVLHDNWVYIYTSETDCNGNLTSGSRNTARYFRLSFNYKWDADLGELCSTEFLNGEQGLNTNTSTCKTRRLPLVDESEARAKMVFGWADAPETVAVTDDEKLVYGYLGYDFDKAKLEFFDDQRNLIWSQPRAIQRLDLADTSQNDGEPRYIAELWPLENHSYLLQLGRDIFIFDSTQTLFDKDFDDIDEILVDRNYQLDPLFDSNGRVEKLANLEFVHSARDVVLRDQEKLFYLDYSAGQYVPSVSTPNFTISHYLDRLQATDFESREYFSQFDLRDCDDEGVRLEQERDAASEPAPTDAEKALVISQCVNANDVADEQLPDPGEIWQFLTECEEMRGCQVIVDNTDYCVTDAELIANPGLADLNNSCSVAEYQDLNELDEAGNDFNFAGYMQYFDKYVRDLKMALSNDLLYLTVRMTEREILMHYDYDVAFDRPISERERVLLGSRYKHFGLESFFRDDNLFVNVLRSQATRHAECYKGYQEVICDLARTDIGSNRSCTAADIEELRCVDHFDEFASFALFCTEESLDAGTCTETACSADDIAMGKCPNYIAPVFNLLVDEERGLRAKWVPIESLDADEDNQILLLSSDDAAEVVDEGILLAPEMWAVDETDGSLSVDALLTLTGQRVESVMPVRQLSSERAQIEWVQNEVIQRETAAGVSEASSAQQGYFSNPALPGPSVEVLSEFQFVRPATAFD